MIFTTIRLHARGCVTAIVCLLGALASPEPVQAQAWPNRPIQAIIPLSAGNAIDVVGRIVLEQVAKQIGQPIIVDNRVGAGGTIGTAAVAKAAPDGYTILIHSSSLSAAHSIYSKLPYDTLKDFAAVTSLGLQPTVLVSAPSKGYRSLADLVDAAKARPGMLNFASAGVGSASHLASERFRLSAKFSAEHIPFRGPAEALTDVIAGRVDFYFLPIAPALQHINDGKLLAHAVSTAKRSAALPQVPTTVEAGLADSSYNFWVGMFVPAATPREIIIRLHEETQKALRVPAVQERLAKFGVEPMLLTPEQFDKYVKDDIAAIAKLVKEAGVPLAN
jgi:tripartite-type tricarboxylate transporter receptor subunit TctC